jgi:hypothetical protein
MEYGKPAKSRAPIVGVEFKEELGDTPGLRAGYVASLILNRMTSADVSSQASYATMAGGHRG